MVPSTLSKERLFAYLIIDNIQVEDAELKMARYGNGLSLSKIGDIYYNKEDYMKAAHWYNLGATEGYAYSQYKLGILYSDGKGVQVDYKLAMEWFMKAHNNGSPVATTCVGYMFDCGQGVAQDYKVAFKWYMKAAVKGYHIAQYNIGSCYEYGEGVRADIQHAIKWYQKSAEQGFSNAKYKVKRLDKNGVFIKNGKRGVDKQEKQPDIDTIGRKIKKVKYKQLESTVQEKKKVTKAQINLDNNGVHIPQPSSKTLLNGDIKLL